MKNLLISLVTSLLFVSFVGSAQCEYDREALLAMDPWEFDQDFERGWRQLEEQEGCLEEAAELIHEFYSKREMHDGMRRLMLWHEGQIRAELEQTERAISLMQQADSAESSESWRYYVRATIAFLEQDFDTLEYTREQLAQVPRPDDLPTHIDEDGNETEMAWPQNLHIVDRLVECFGEPYMAAYTGCTP